MHHSVWSLSVTGALDYDYDDDDADDDNGNGDGGGRDDEEMILIFWNQPLKFK